MSRTRLATWRPSTISGVPRSTTAGRSENDLTYAPATARPIPSSTRRSPTASGSRSPLRGRAGSPLVRGKEKNSDAGERGPCLSERGRHAETEAGEQGTLPGAASKRHQRHQRQHVERHLIRAGVGGRKDPERISPHAHEQTPRQQARRGTRGSGRPHVPLRPRASP